MAATLDGRPWSPRGGPSVFWLDLGNSRDSGQVLLGNATRPEGLRGAFDAERGLCRALPAPSLQRPDLLDAPPPAPRVDCAAAVAAGDQSRTINQLMAALGAAFVERLLDGRLGWMAAYVDADDGLLRTVAAEPRAVAAAAGLDHRAVLAAPRRVAA
jgi:hypothetical protein